MKKIEQLLLLQNTLCLILTGIVLCGTSAPILFQLLTNRDVSTGAPFFNGFFIPLVFCVLLLLLYAHSLLFTRFKKNYATIVRTGADDRSILPQLSVLIKKLFSRDGPSIEREWNEPTGNLSIGDEVGEFSKITASFRGTRKEGAAKRRSQFIKKQQIVILLVLFHLILFHFIAGFSLTESIYCVLCFALWCLFCI